MSNNKNIEEKNTAEIDNNAISSKPKKIIKKVKEEQYSEETLNLSLYYEIASTIYNSLGNIIVRKAIASDENLLNILELQISNLLFLEKELPDLKDKNYAREFLQIISNLVNRSLTISKSSVKNRIEMLEERNLLIVSITNSYKTVERETLERIRQFDNDTFNELNNQILALNNFSDVAPENKTVAINVNNTPNTNTILNNNLPPNTNLNNLDNNSLANLTKMGVLPQHPVTNPKFYPYISKPKQIPLLKKILAAFLVVTTLVSLTAYILTFFIAGNVIIKTGDSPVYYNFGRNSQSVVLTIVTTIIISGGFVYSILKPPRLGRDLYRISYFMIVILIMWILYNIINMMLMTTDNALNNSFKVINENKDPIESALTWLKGLETFKTFKILSYVSTAVSIFPIAVALVIAILNPKIDKNKIIKANSEYQNAINSALNGQKYEIDPSLFDDSLDDKKDKDTHKFWRQSDLFK